MPNLTRLARVARLATLPETRRAIVAVGGSNALRVGARRMVHDRAALLRDIARPASARKFVRGAVRHPAVGELASAGLMFLPGRYLPLGWVASWAARRILRRLI